MSEFKHSKQVQPDPDLMLLEFWEEGYSNSRARAVMNNVDVIFDGNVFTRTKLEVTPPSSENEQSTTQISISNISRIAGRTVLSARGKIRVRVMWVDGEDYTIDTGGTRVYGSLLYDTDNMMVVDNIEANVLTVSGDLLPRAEPLMGYPFTKTSEEFFPGLWIKR